MNRMLTILENHEAVAGTTTSRGTCMKVGYNANEYTTMARESARPKKGIRMKKSIYRVTWMDDITDELAEGRFQLRYAYEFASEWDLDCAEALYDNMNELDRIIDELYAKQDEAQKKEEEQLARENGWRYLP